MLWSTMFAGRMKVSAPLLRTLALQVPITRQKHVKVGDYASTSKVFGEKEVSLFAELSTDVNPIHLDKEYAKTTRFKRPIVHGILTTSLLSAVVGNQLPGIGSIYVSQVFNFKKPVYVGDEVTAKVEITHIQKERKMVTLKTVCTVRAVPTGDTQDKSAMDQIVIDGEAVIYYPYLE